jgi:site-specific DNA recombinase
VRVIFDLYLEYRSLRPVVEDLGWRGWCTKQSVTRHGQVRGGRAFTKNSLYQLLTNVTYIGQVRYKHEVHPGEQPAVVEQAVWQDVQTLLAANGQARAERRRTRSRAMLQGLLHCKPCGCAMTPAQVTRSRRRYRYYTCSAAQRKGWHTCPSKSVPALALERYVLEQIAPHAQHIAWPSLAPAEQAERLRQVVTRIDYDGTNGQVAISLRPNSPSKEDCA